MISGKDYLETKGEEDFGNWFKPVQPSDARKGTHLSINGFPTKVVAHSTSKTGKHGHAKCNIAGMCVVTDTKQTFMGPAHGHGLYVPNVTKTEYACQGFNIEQDEAEGTFILWDEEKQSQKEDIPFVPGSVAIHQQIKEAYDKLGEESGMEIWVGIIKAPKISGKDQYTVCEKIVSFTTKQEGKS